MMNWELEYPWVLFALLLVPLALWWLGKRKKTEQRLIQLPDIAAFGSNTKLWHKLRPMLSVLRALALCLMIIALARPRKVEVTVDTDGNQGIDILLVVDTSLSMLAKDLNPDRLEALKKVVVNFAKKRTNDRLGLIEYSGESVARVPLTTDREILIKETESLESGTLYPGTAIGVGLATGINHLKNSKAKSKVIILITDGVEDVDENSGLIYISPKNAADIAKEQNIKVYTIGIGTNGFALFPYQRDLFTNELLFRRVPVEIDEQLLTEIAEQTNGKYFRAKDNEELEAIYDEIDQLEKTKIESIKYYNYTEVYPQLLLAALLFLLTELGLRSTLFREFG